MKEDYWDPINRAAALVTIFTGVPAFLTFVGLPYVAEVLLGVLSITSLSFVLIRGRKLQARGDRLAILNKNDEELISSFNNIISGRAIDRSPSFDLESLVVNALNNIKEYVESDTSCKAVVSIREIKPNLDVVQTIASSNQDTKPIVINLDKDSGFSSVWYGDPTRVFYPQDKSKYENYRTPQFTLAYQTAAIFPIMAKPESGDNEHRHYWGFLVVDIEKERKISDETKSVLMKYSHLFFLLFSSLDQSLNSIAQR